MVHNPFFLEMSFSGRMKRKKEAFVQPHPYHMPQLSCEYVQTMKKRGIRLFHSVFHLGESIFAKAAYRADPVFR
jgi:hypothetical protein